MNVVLAVAETGDATRLVSLEIDELVFGAFALAVVVIGVVWLAFRRPRHLLKDRENLIRGELKRAEQARMQAEEVREQCRFQIAEARVLADQVIGEATATAEEVRRDIIVRAEEESRRILDKARSAATLERGRVLAEMSREVAELALQAAARVVEKELSDPQVQRQLVEQFIVQVGMRRR